MNGFLSFLRRLRKNSLAKRSSRRHRLATPESLEPRVVLFVASGNAWPSSQLITLSIMPDGTNLGGKSSNLSAAFNAKPSLVGWQNQILKAAQTWAQQTDLNFTLVTDSGASSGSGDYQQGDPGFGDIRIGGYSFGNTTLASAMMPPPINNYSIAGDITFNTSQTFNIGTTYDLFTVAAHEIGHALGLGHSTVSTQAEMFSAYTGVKPTLYADDIAGIRSIYSANAARSKDAYDNAAANETSATATNVTSQIDPTLKTAVLNNLDITTTADIDYFKFTAPAGSSSTLTVKVQSSGLSLFAPKAWVYNASQVQLATATGTGFQGSTLTMSVSGIVAGQTYYVKVDGVDATAFGTGRYAVTLNLGGGANPTVTLANTQLANGSPLSSGGGVAEAPSTKVTAIMRDTVARSAERVTSDRSIIISGTATSHPLGGSHVTIVDGNKVLGTTTTTSKSARNSASPTGLLGTHHFRTFAADTLGHNSLISDVLANKIQTNVL